MSPTDTQQDSSQTPRFINIYDQLYCKKFWKHVLGLVQ